MDTVDILGLIFLGFIIVLVIGCIILENIASKEKKEAYALLDDFENTRKLKKTNPDLFTGRCFRIITALKPGHWTGFRVKQSKHGKGWFVEGDYFKEKRFWPSSDKFGTKYYPDSYLSQGAAEYELLNVLEKLVDFYIYWENSGREFEAKRED